MVEPNVSGAMSEPFPIKAVAHVSLRVPDLDAAVDHAEAVLGLRLTERVGDSAFLSADARHHCVEYVADNRTALDHVGLEARSVETVELIGGRLDAEGVRRVDSSEPGVGRSLRFEGPAGHVFEVYADMDETQPATYETSGIKPVQFGHVTLKADEIEPTEEFLVRLLGFRVSDRVDEGLGTWMRCGQAHHHLAVMRGGNGIHHYGFDIISIADLERLGDRLAERGARLLYGPGRHGVGNNLFTYHRDPAGFIVEHGCELEQIDVFADHEPRLWPNDPNMENLWGPPPEDPEFNDWWTPLVPPAELERPR